VNEEYIWVIDDDRSIRWVLEKAFKQADMNVTCFESADEALEMIRSNAIPPDAIVCDIRMPGSDGLALLKQLKQQQTDTPVLIMTAFSDLDSTVSAIEGGAFEYISKPFDVDDVIDKTRRACQTHREKLISLHRIQENTTGRFGFNAESVQSHWPAFSFKNNRTG